MTDTVVTGFYGGDRLESIETENVKTGRREAIELDGVFIAVGQIPQSGVFKDILDTDADGFLLCGENCKPERQGFFVAGDCRTKDIRQLTTAAADGSVAAVAACRYIDEIV